MSVAGLVAAGCVAAGIWQWHRHEQRSIVVDRVLVNYDAAPVALAELLTEPTETAGPSGLPVLPPEAEWHPATVRGHYLTDVSGAGQAALLRNRPVGGVPGFHLLQPFRITEGELAGTVLVVDRGWVHTGSDSSAPASVPPTPDGSLDLVVRPRAGEPSSRRTAPGGQVHSIAVDQVRAAVGDGWPAEATLPFYGQAVTEDGAAPVGLGALARPSTDLGSHLSYTFQWWVFALGALGGGVLLAVREGRADADGRYRGGPEAEAATSGAEQADDRSRPDRPAPARHRPTRRRRPTAEEEEDALIDAQLR